MDESHSDYRTRQDDATVAELLKMMHSLLQSSNAHSAEIVEISRKIDLVIAAFPDGGLVAHRLAHERWMASDKSAAALRDGVTRNIISGGAWATILIVAYALWEYLKTKLK